MTPEEFDRAAEATEDFAVLDDYAPNPDFPDAEPFDAFPPSFKQTGATEDVPVPEKKEQTEREKLYAEIEAELRGALKGTDVDDDVDFENQMGEAIRDPALLDLDTRKTPKVIGVAVDDEKEEEEEDDDDDNEEEEEERPQAVRLVNLLHFPFFSYRHFAFMFTKIQGNNITDYSRGTSDCQASQ